MSEETDVKLKCLQIAAEASSRVGQYSAVDVVAQAASFFEWVKEGSRSPLTVNRSPKKKRA